MFLSPSSHFSPHSQSLTFHCNLLKLVPYSPLHSHPSISHHFSMSWSLPKLSISDHTTTVVQVGVSIFYLNLFIYFCLLVMDLDYLLMPIILGFIQMIVSSDLIFNMKWETKTFNCLTPNNNNSQLVFLLNGNKSMQLTLIFHK